jgi:7-cyano-7-deazaguanine synthase
MIDDNQVAIPNRVIIILSGGMDSTTLLYRIIAEKKEVYALSFNYGQKHSKELLVAHQTTEKLHIPHKVLNLSLLQQSGIFGDSSLTSDVPVPEGYYTDESMKSTVVPNRNMLMLSIAIAYAISIRAEAVYYGAHAGDHAIYPDCRPTFVEKMQEVAKYCHYYPIDIRVPYLNQTKGDIVADGMKLGVDYSLTWTCYKGGERSCGKCGSCQERLEAFAQNGIKDPLEYIQ